ncbi:MAG: T9SS type A sorting domain-containing protein [Sphingobacteriales bacterium]|nr:T9SS type A sorting domain-containing protein [Sphingobacteriales bacterium]
MTVALAWYAVGVGYDPTASHYIVGPTQLTPGYVANYSLNPYYNATNYVWTIPGGCATGYCWAIVSGQGTSNVSIRAGSTGIKTITCRAYLGNTLLGSQYITVNVQTPNTGGGSSGGGNPCGSIASFNGVIYPPTPCNGGGLIAQHVYFKEITIFDLVGRIVKHETNVDQVDTECLPQGMYMVRATLDNQEVIIKKILK